MYIPFLVTISYLYLAGKKQIEPIDIDAASLVFYNLFQIELIYFLTWLFYIFPDEYNFINFGLIIILQDVWFFTTHKLAHVVKPIYAIHSIHHKYFGAFYAFHAHKLDHLIINIGSIAVPFFIFPINSNLLNVMMLIQIYIGVNTHTINAPHHIHHLNVTKRLGTFYIMDKLFGSY
jgi:sterol desaturase/sphingolipid hydroxylase (fatty acid hydroxylase superfamily)